MFIVSRNKGFKFGVWVILVCRCRIRKWVFKGGWRRIREEEGNEKGRRYFKVKVRKCFKKEREINCLC